MAKTLQEVMADLQLASRGSYDRNAMDIQDHVLFDNNPFQTGTARPETNFFQQPVGSPYMGGSKTLTETNMELQGQIPNSQYFLVEEISFALVSSHEEVGTNQAVDVTVRDYARLIRSSNIRLVLAGRSYDLEVPGTVFVPPVFENGVNGAANPQRAGEHTASGWMKLKLPIVIEGGAAFNVKMLTRAASATVEAALNEASDDLASFNAQLQCRLKGTLIRYK